MATGTLTNQTKDASGTAIPSLTITVTLKPGPGYSISDAHEITRKVTVTSDASGYWSVPLEQNANITPANSYYEISEPVPAANGGPITSAVRIVAGTQTVYAARITNPQPAPAEGALTQTNADARYVRIGQPVQVNTTNVWTADQLFASGVPYVDARAEGADPTFATDSRTALQAAIDVAGAQYTPVPPSGGGLAGSVPTVFLPHGRYKVTDKLVTTAPGTAYLRIISDGRAIIECTDATKDVFDCTGAYMVQMRGVILVGGKRQIALANQNVDSSQLLLDDCEFYRNNNGFMIDTDFVSPATNLSCNVVLRNCKIVNPYKVMRNNVGVHATVQDTWVESITGAANGALFENRNQLVFGRMYGTPPTDRTGLAAIRWVDNYGQFYATESRFGSEGAGMPIVYNYAGQAANALGGVVSIHECFTAIGPAASSSSALVNFQTHVPALMDFRGNYGLFPNNNVSPAGRVIVDSIPGGVGAYINALAVGSQVHLNLDTQLATFVLDQDGTANPLPLALYNTDPTKVFVTLNGSRLEKIGAGFKATGLTGAQAQFTWQNLGTSGKEWRASSGQVGVTNDRWVLRNITDSLDALIVLPTAALQAPVSPLAIGPAGNALHVGSGVPNNAVGSNGDFYFRTDGGAGTAIYQRRAGVWAATAA